GESATDDLLTVLDAASVPLLATLRPRRQGGRFEGPEDVRLNLLAAAGQAGFGLLDVELDALVPGLVTELRKGGAGLVVSHHLGESPCRSDGLQPLQAMQDADARLDKLAFEAGAFPDALRALELAREHALRGGHPTVSTMGYGGGPLRALLALAGNQATYGHSPGLAPAVPGQPDILEVVRVWQHWGLRPQDLGGKAHPWLAVLGLPALHSLSPRLHNAAFRAAGRPERFGALDVPASPGALRLAFHAAQRIGMAGASITHPHKAEAARVAACDEVARQVGAANCVRFTPEGAVATNTDATALRRLLAPLVKPGASVAILGAGGAARAAAWALQGMGAKVQAVARRPEQGRALEPLGAAFVPWDDRFTLRPSVWVQATTLGLQGQASPLEGHDLRGAALVELNYAAGRTALQRQAEAAGCPVIGGRAVLLEQAVDAYRFWTGAEPDRAAMAGHA
ncbi:MAG TPA: type I 3-dehydroquinate dehydratase, partial [Candidatus Thermoplasmatota archaeon]|nr:type I 3-dehydroquinate dehydratase [Candidatus Thermoplasmatota archaeon]